MIFGAAAGVALSLLSPSVNPAALLDRPLEILLCALGAYYVGVVLHECGHLIAGFHAGFAFRHFVAGPCVWRRESDGIRFRFATARLLSGGQVAMAPESTERLRERFLEFISGGSIATAVLFLIPIVLPASLFTRCFLVVNVLLAASSWIPFTVNGRSTDARLFFGLLRAGPAADRLAAILYLLALDSRGTPPREWPADLVRQLEEETELTAHREIGLTFVYFCAMDRGDPERIAGALERVLAFAHQMHPDSRRAYFAEAAFVQGMFRKDAVRAREWLADARHVKGTLPREDWDCAALAGIAVAEGELGQARTQLKRSIAMLDRQPGHSGSVAACRACLASLLEVI